jgi:hypothetical protein
VTTTGLVRVLIATTQGPVAVENLEELPAALGLSVACIGGSDDKVPIQYQSFVDKGTGVITEHFGHDSFRMDLSSRIDDGKSWQLGVYIAHALHHGGRLACKSDEATAVVLATGQVKRDRSVDSVGFLPDKLRQSFERLEAEATAKRQIVVVWPKADGAGADDGARTTLRQLGAKLLEVEDVRPVLKTLGLAIEAADPPPDLPAQAEAIEAADPPDLPAQAEAILQDVPQRDVNFVDRANELAELCDLLINGHRDAANAHSPAPTKCVVIWGESGVGKTAFATEYAHRYRTYYSGVWYASAEHLSPLVNNLARFLGKIDLPMIREVDKEKAAKAGVAQFPSFNPPFLLIYDNVPLTYNADGNFASHLRDLIPTTGAHILLIAGFLLTEPAHTRHTWSLDTDTVKLREREARSFREKWLSTSRPVSSAAHLELDRLTPDFATQFVQKRAERMDPWGAARLAKELSYLPVDLDQAARHCRQTGMLFDTYREKFGTYGWKIRRSTGAEAEHYRKSAPTFGLRIAKLIVEDAALARARIGGTTKKPSGEIKGKLELVRALELRSGFYPLEVMFTTGGTRIIAKWERNCFAWDAESGDLIFESENLPFDEENLSFNAQRKLSFDLRGDLSYAGPYKPPTKCATSRDGEWTSYPRAASIDGKWVALGIEDRIEIRRYGQKDSKVALTIGTPSKFWVRSIAFSPDGRWLVSNNCRDDIIRCWDLRKALKSPEFLGRPFYYEVGRELGPGGWANRLGFSPDGKMVASSNDHRLTLWNFETRKQEWVLDSSGVPFPQTKLGVFFYRMAEKTPKFRELPFAFSRDGNWIVGGFEEKIKVLDAITGNTLREIRAHPECVYSVAFSPDGTHIVSSGRENVIKVWRL